MSLVHTVDVFCDGKSPDCRTWTPGAIPPNDPREAARRAGWKRVRVPRDEAISLGFVPYRSVGAEKYTLDLCPVCAAAVKKETQSP